MATYSEETVKRLKLYYDGLNQDAKRRELEEKKNNYTRCRDFMAANYEQISGEEFYRELFPNNETSMDCIKMTKSPNHYENDHFQKPNAIYLYRDPVKGRLRRRIMLADTWEDDYREYIEANNLTLCSGLAYRGKANKLQQAQLMNAMIIDLDGVGIEELTNFLAQTAVTEDPSKKAYAIPIPTFLILSGSGLHIYYQFDEPITLYPNIKLQLKQLKYNITFRCWQYKHTSKIKDTQYQSINQTFRMVGSINNKYGTEVVAFRVGEKVSLDYLNSYARPENKVDIYKPFQPTKYSRDAAAEKFPQWYMKVVVRGDHKPDKWDIAGKVHGKDPFALYHWWLAKAGQIKGGHRYFFMMNLAIYACKCDVPKKKLIKDIREAFEILKQEPNLHTDGTPDELNENDIQSALEAYDKEYYCWKLEDVESTSGLKIPRNRRNGQKQEWHLEDIRDKKKNMKRRGQAFKNPEGRPTAQKQVADWQSEHPTGKKIDCHRETGLSRVTIDKWWSTIKQ